MGPVLLQGETVSLWQLKERCASSHLRLVQLLGRALTRHLRPWRGQWQS